MDNRKSLACPAAVNLVVLRSLALMGCDIFSLSFHEVSERKLLLERRQITVPCVSSRKQNVLGAKKSIVQYVLYVRMVHKLAVLCVRRPLALLAS